MGSVCLSGMTNDQRRQQAPDIVILLGVGLLSLLIVVWLPACAIPGTPGATASPVGVATPTTRPSQVATSAPAGVPRPTATATPIPSPTWEALKNTGYPNEWPSEGVAQLEDGEYRE